MWDRLEHDLVERVVEGDTTPCVTLGLTLLVGPVDEYPVGLRLARDAEGNDLVLTEKEGRLAEARAREAAVLAGQAETLAREAETLARRKAEARVAELEKKLAARGPKGR